MNNIPTDLNNYTFIGRFDTQDPNGPRFAWSNSEIHANVQNTTSVAVILTDNTNDYYNVVIDGNQTMILATSPGYYTYPLATGLSTGTHAIELHKRTEFRQGTAQFGGFYLDANATFLQPTPPLSRHLLFIGTSGLTGYCVDESNLPNGIKDPIQKTTNADLGIPKVTANLLQADVINISDSGCGIYQSAYSDPLLPTEFNQTLPYDATATWNPNMNPNAIPNAIIIEAGGDDLVVSNSTDGNFYFNPNINIAMPIFVTAFVNFIQTLRSDYPNALIIILMIPSASGAQYQTLYTAFNEVVSQSGQNVVYYNIFEHDPNNNCGTVQPVQYNYFCGNQGNLHVICGHPDQIGAAYIANILAAYIKTSLNW